MTRSYWIVFEIEQRIQAIGYRIDREVFGF